MKLPYKVLLFIIIVIAAYRPIIDSDMYLGVATGKYILTNHTIPFHEVFSWSAQGRPYVPYEWLSQTVVALLYTTSGIVGVSLLVAVLFATTVFLLFAVTQNLLISTCVAVLIYPFFTPRPYVFGITFFLLMLYALKRRGPLLWTTIPLVYVWSNMHTSFLFAPYLFLAYGTINWMSSSRTHAPRTHAKLLVGIGLLQLVVSLLPPLGLAAYQLFWQILSDMKFIQQYYEEWKPLTAYPIYLVRYLSTIGAFIAFALFTQKHNKTPSPTPWLFALPMLPFILAPFSALRHLPWGFIAFALALHYATKPIHITFRKIFWIAIAILIAIGGFQKHTLMEANWHLPQTAIEFLKTHKLKGKMFNDMPIGGFLAAELYPDYQIYFDGRAEVFGHHEHRTYYELSLLKRTSQESFSKNAQAFVDANQFSYLIIPTSTYNPLEFSTASMIADSLMNDENWRLIYVSDYMRILIKRDGNNDDIFYSLGTTAITPYKLTQYKPGMEQNAITEYLRMIALKDSGIAQSGLGQAYLATGKIQEAQAAFEHAATINTHIGRPYLGLAKIALLTGNNAQAKTYLQKSIAISPYLGESYLLLAERFTHEQNTAAARATLEQGLTQNIDFITRQKIIQAIHKL